MNSCFDTFTFMAASSTSYTSDIFVAEIGSPKSTVLTQLFVLAPVDACPLFTLNPFRKSSPDFPARSDPAPSLYPFRLGAIILKFMSSQLGLIQVSSTLSRQKVEYPNFVVWDLDPEHFW